MTPDIPKSSQDIIGVCLSKWRNNKVAKEVKQPFLDIACGDNILAKKIGGGFGIDVVNYGGADILVKDFNELPFKTGSFNSVSIVASLNYFEKPQRVLLESARVLKPEGSVILTLIDPFIGRLWHMLREPWAKYPGFSHRQLKALTQGTGLTFARRSRFMLGINSVYIFIKS
ncbi:class I SAM-dependent methyltransferase [bacterium]|nr:class I SAM-dependent methyltransferase [bacterium]